MIDWRLIERRMLDIEDGWTQAPVLRMPHAEMRLLNHPAVEDGVIIRNTDDNRLWVYCKSERCWFAHFHVSAEVRKQPVDTTWARFIRRLRKETHG